MDAEDDAQKSVRIDFTLRSRQVQYLEYLSERDGEPFSHALAKIITWALQNLMVDAPGRTEKVRKHVMIPEECLDFVDILSSRWGLPRSDVVRRLVDDAMARDTTI